MKVIVGTKNQTKINAAINVLSDYFGKDISVEGVKAPSNVSDMPLTDNEAIKGAKNRAIFCLENTDCDLGIGIEGSVRVTDYGLFMTCWCVAIDKESGLEGVGCGAQIKLPDAIKDDVLKEKEIGKIFLALPEKFGYKKEFGAMGYLTGETFSRMDAISTALRMTLAPIARKELYLLDSWK